MYIYKLGRYTPSFGYCMLQAVLLSWLYKRNRAAALVAFLTVGGVYTRCTVHRDREWGNPRKLWESAVETCPENFVSHVLLGNIYDSDGDTDKALASFEKSR
jgi:hypothetical protein